MSGVKFVKIVERMLRAGEGRAVKRLEGIAAQVNAIEEDFEKLTDAELRAVIGPNSRHVALIEDAFKVLVEAPGGGYHWCEGRFAEALRAHTCLSDRLW